MDENYDYEEVVSLKSDYTNNHEFLINYDKNIKNPIPITFFSAYKQGFITNILNIKAGLFFISLYSFINPETPNYLLFFYGSWMSVITGLWFILLTFLLTSKLIKSTHLIIMLT